MQEMSGYSSKSCCSVSVKMKNAKANKVKAYQEKLLHKCKSLHDSQGAEMHHTTLSRPIRTHTDSRALPLQEVSSIKHVIKNKTQKLNNITHVEQLENLYILLSNKEVSTPYEDKTSLSILISLRGTDAPSLTLELQRISLCDSLGG